MYYTFGPSLYKSRGHDTSPYVSILVYPFPSLTIELSLISIPSQQLSYISSVEKSQRLFHYTDHIYYPMVTVVREKMKRRASDIVTDLVANSLQICLTYVYMWQGNRNDRWRQLELDRPISCRNSCLGHDIILLHRIQATVD